MEPQEISKNAQKKAAKEAMKLAAKQKRAEEAAAKAAAEKAAEEAVYSMPEPLKPSEVSKARFGIYPVHSSQPEIVSAFPDRKFTSIDDIETLFKEKDVEEQYIWVRGRVHTNRHKGRSVFLVLRGKMDTVQACAFASTKPTFECDIEDQSQQNLVYFLGRINCESVVDIYARLVKAPQPIKSTTVNHYELAIERAFVISQAAANLPLLVTDAMRSDSAYVTKNGEPCEYVNPGRDTRLNNRVLDLRTPANQAIFRVRACIAQEFRAYLTSKGFTEISSPKIIGGSSEGGSAIFHVDYFGQEACLAQSPQLYKQMAIASGMERVFEVGPVFRAENSHTHRHLCEFTGLDLEMEIHESYHEVLEILSGLMKHIFTVVLEKCEKEISVIRAQYDLTMGKPLEWAEKTVIIPYSEGIKMLQQNGFPNATDQEDLTTPMEKALGALVKEAYHTDFYILDKFPMSVRPFYTMPDPTNPLFSNSYDMFIRGEEITSGAQRIHDKNLLESVCRSKEMPVESIKDYAEAFRYGCPPHGGAGIGLERVIMLMLGIDDCRQCCLFPRTPERLTP